MEHEKTDSLNLPWSVTSRIDVGRLLREFQALDNFLRQAVIRDPGAKIDLPRTSLLFEEMASANKVNILQETDRKRIIQFLESTKAEAPVLHISFNAYPPPLFTKKLVSWLRKEVHPMVLLQIGLQPNIGAGCVVRTTNKYFDFSLRERFIERRELLTRSLHVAAQAPSSAPTAGISETHTP